MAQNKFSANLSSADFVLSASYKGRSVIIPGQDQNYYQATAGFAGDTPQRGINIPQVYYCENTVPTAEGYRSVAYRFFIEPTVDQVKFVKVVTVFDGQGNSAIIGVTATRDLYIVSPYTTGAWQKLTLPNNLAWDNPGTFTSTSIIGVVYICLQGTGIFTLNIVTSTLAKATAQGIDDTKIVGLCAASSYGIVWDTNKVYWSSTVNPLDFTPSLITGAGSGTPEGLKGKIVLCKEISQGFIVYSDICILSASYSANLANPWVFAVLQGGAGIRSAEAVGYDLNLSSHFAWTSAGFTGIELHEATLLLPQLTDVIAAGVSDSTSTPDGFPVTSYNPDAAEVRLSLVSSRYVVISFGTLQEGLPNQFQVPLLKQAFLWDTKLKRWGKLNIDHVQIFEAPFTTNPPVFFYTSKPYPVVSDDNMSIIATRLLNAPSYQYRENLQFSASILSGTLRNTLVQYNNYQRENISISAVSISEGTLRNLLKSYANYQTENLQFSTPSMTGGTIKTVLISYTYYSTESINFNPPVITGGTLTGA